MLDRYWVLIVVGWLVTLAAAEAQEPVTYRAAIVALAGDDELRHSFEDSLVAKARAHRYDAVVSYDIVPDVDDLDSERIVEILKARGIQAVLMLRPAAIGAGSSLDSVRDAVSPGVYADMRSFANRISASASDDLIAVVHMAIYTLADEHPALISAGAVWLDEAVDSRDEGIERLQDIMLANVDAVRPAIREHLGLPPLP